MPSQWRPAVEDLTKKKSQSGVDCPGRRKRWGAARVCYSCTKQLVWPEWWITSPLNTNRPLRIGCKWSLTDLDSCKLASDVVVLGQPRESTFKRRQMLRVTPRCRSSSKSFFFKFSTKLKVSYLIRQWKLSWTLKRCLLAEKFALPWLEFPKTNVSASRFSLTQGQQTDGIFFF